MDALTLINQHIDIERLLEHYDFQQSTSDGDYIRSCCKLHGGNNPSAFVINKESGLWYCHTNADCGAGDAYTLVQRMENVNFPQAVHWLANFFNVDITNLKINQRKASYISELKRWIRFMKSTKKEETQEYSLDATMREVVKFRSFKPETLQHFGLKYIDSIACERADGSTYNLSNRLIIPIHNEYGVQIGVSLRATKKGDFPKWSHQPKNVKTSSVLYNYDVIKSTDNIVVVEGIFDVWAWHEIDIPAVATYGAHISKEQHDLLIKSGADIVLAFDGDNAGKIATRKAIKLFKNKSNLSVIQFNQDEDSENITREELMKKYEQRTRIH